MLNSIQALELARESNRRDSSHDEFWSCLANVSILSAKVGKKLTSFAEKNSTLIFFLELAQGGEERYFSEW